MPIDPRLHASLQASIAGNWSADRAKAEFYGRFVGAAYAMGEGPMTMPPPAAPGLPAGYNVIADIYMTDFVFAKDQNPTHYGLLASDGAGHNILAIRGTVGWKEWWADLLSLRLVDCVFNGSPQVFGQVGYGFLALYNTLRAIPRTAQVAGLAPASVQAMAKAQETASFATAIHGIIKAHAARAGTAAVMADPTVDVVGHSLGSALATLYAVDHHAGPNNFPAGRLCTFASPMVGNTPFKAAFVSGFLHNDPERSWRFFISSDVVPDVPPAVAGFVPIDDGIELKLGWDARWWWPPCSHSLSSYLHVLDASWPLPSDCTGAPASPDRGMVPTAPPVAVAAI